MFVSVLGSEFALVSLVFGVSLVGKRMSCWDADVRSVCKRGRVVCVGDGVGLKGGMAFERTRAVGSLSGSEVCLCW